MKLFDKIYGCEAAAAIGNSMGEIMEGWTVDERREKLGYVESLLPVTKEDFDGRLNRTNPADVNLGMPLVYHGHTRLPGTTEDGEERRRLCSTAIIEKGGRIDIMDLARVWVRDVRPQYFGYLMGPQDQVIYYTLKAGVPPWDVGRFASWPGFYGTTKMIPPVGMVNACNPAQAKKDAIELGLLKDVRGVSGNYAIEVCSAMASSVAEALKPDATIDSVVDTALDCLSWSPRSDCEEAIRWAKNCDNCEEYGKKFEAKYTGRPVSWAVEIFSAALGLLYMADGDPKKAIIYGVNSGRDTDCRASTAGAICGALKGISAIPQEWVDTVDAAMKVNEYTVSNRTLRETSEGIYVAAKNTIAEMKKVSSLFDSML